MFIPPIPEELFKGSYEMRTWNSPVASRGKAMKKIGFMLLVIGVAVLLISSGAGAVSVGLVDGNNTGDVALDFSSFTLTPGYNFGYINNDGFHTIVPGALGAVTQDFIGVSVVNFALQALSNPSSIFEAATVFFWGQTASHPNLYHTATLQFSDIPFNVTVAAAQNFPPDGLTPASQVTPNPEPATLLLLSSMMGVGYGTLRKKLRNQQGKRTV